MEKHRLIELYDKNRNEYIGTFIFDENEMNIREAEEILIKVIEEKVKNLNPEESNLEEIVNNELISNGIIPLKKNKIYYEFE